MNSTIISSLFLFSFFLFVLVSAGPSLPSTNVAHQSVSSSSNNNLNNNNNHNNNNNNRNLHDTNPTTGNHRLLVLTVQYPDRAGSSYSGQQWKDGTFSEFVSFFKAQSYNQLQYEVDVVTVDENGVPAINSNSANQYIPMPSNITSYANLQHGWNFASGYSLHTVVRDAAMYLDQYNFDWAPYTINGRVVNVVVMSAGHDYRYAEQVVSDASAQYLLSTSYHGVQYHVSNGATLNAYTFCNEHTQKININNTNNNGDLRMAQLGQCAHEFGHSLGLPDLYDLSAQSTGVGYFDLMGYGLYANDEEGSKPTGLSAWSKLSIGWINPQVITSAQQNVQLGPSSSSSSNFLQIFPNSSSSSYFLVENRQSIDTWDKNFASQLNNGIVIWQVNPDSITQFKHWNTINSLSSPHLSFPTPSTPSMVVREADGRQNMINNIINNNGVLDYGSSNDVWQAGRSYTVAGTTFRIVVVARNDNSFSLSVVFPSSSSPSPIPTPPLPYRPPSSSPPSPSRPSTPKPTSSPPLPPSS